MNARQAKRVKTLINVLAHKIKTEQDMELADTCLQACGTKGCVWGDFVVQMHGLKLAEFNARSPGILGDFWDFAEYIHNPTLKSISKLLFRSNGYQELENYFGMPIHEDRIFGAAEWGTWEERYLRMVSSFHKHTGVKFDPLKKVTL